MQKSKKRALLIIVKRSLYILIIVCSLCVMAGIYHIVKIQAEYLRADSFYDKLEQVADDDKVVASNSQDARQNDLYSVGINFSQLKAISSDIVAWIKIPNTKMDYPVVHGTDNVYFLTHLPNHSYSKSGSIFMNFKNSEEFSDKNTVLFGHNMKNGSMFAGLSYYKDPKYVKTHPEMEVFLPNAKYSVKWFSGYINTDGVVPTSFSSEEVYMEYINMLLKKSDFENRVQIGAEDRIVTLCTCTYEKEGARYILTGVLRKERQY